MGAGGQLGGFRIPAARPGGTPPSRQEAFIQRSLHTKEMLCLVSSSHGPCLEVFFFNIYFSIEETEALVTCPRSHSSAKELGLNSSLFNNSIASTKLLELHY